VSYLLDTGVVSELTAVQPSAEVVRWFRDRDPSELRLSSVTVGELRHGVESLPPGAKRLRLQRVLEDWIDEFGSQLLPFGLAEAEVWGRLRRRAERSARPVASIPAMLAATAEVHGLTLVTRRPDDFEGWGGPVLNPWTPQPPVKP
jgi:predicted nucleic acid-binding protein